MLTEKHRPNELKDFAGYPSLIEVLRGWAEQWDKGNPQKPLLFAGKPGIGKTSLAMAIANEFDWELLEMNASDLRDKKSIERIAGFASCSRTFSGKLRLILFDEVDGLYRADRGGSTAVLNIVKEAKCPIILTANNAWDRKISSIRSAAQLIDFKKIHSTSIRKLLREIAQKEGIEASEEILMEIAKSSNGDIRSALNDLESLSLLGKLDDDSKDLLNTRNRKENIFDAVRKILKTEDYWESKNVLNNILEDPQTLMNWIEENIPKEYQDSEDLYNAFESLSRADIFFGRTRRRQNYSLWRYAIPLMTSGVSLAKKERYHSFTRYAFPQKIMYLSRTKKKRELKKSISLKVGRKCHTSIKTAMFDYIPLIEAMMKKYPAELVAEFGLTEDEIKFLGVKSPKKIIDEAQKIKEKKIMDRIQPKKPVASSLADFS